MKMKLLALAGAMVLGLHGLAVAQGSNAAPMPAGDAGRGKALFAKDGCYECHGYVGQGGPGVRLAPNPLPASAIAAYIHNPTGEMPPYTSKVVSDQDVSDIRAYLATIPAPPKLADIPLLAN
jgi:ubiquinol-cytochrome c reductase cytochrome c subunit